jgi:diphthine-ammonia ligase
MGTPKRSLLFVSYWQTDEPRVSAFLRVLRQEGGIARVWSVGAWTAGDVGSPHRRATAASKTATKSGQSVRTPRRAAVSWSGGKDSCLALILAAESGLTVSTLLTMADPDGSSKSHALPERLITAQAKAMRLAYVFIETGPGNYRRAFCAALDELHHSEHSHMVFGDIDLQAHRDWLKPLCHEAGLEPVFPLWGMKRADVAREIVERGIRARLVCVDTARLAVDYCGCEYDSELLARLPVQICPCGEDGEFHTFVWDAPLFTRPLRLEPGAQVKVASKPPLTPTELVFQIPELVEAPA